MLRPTRRCSSIASSPASQSIRCSQGSASRGHREDSARATSSTLTVPGKRNESRASDRGQKLLPPAVITRYARKSLSEIVFCKIGQQAVSDPRSGVNSVPQRRTFAPQWDSRTRPAKRQHHRCIGCAKKTLLSFLRTLAKLARAPNPSPRPGLLLRRLKPQVFAV